MNHGLWLCSQLNLNFFYFSFARFFLSVVCKLANFCAADALQQCFFVHQQLCVKAPQAWRQILMGPLLVAVSINTSFSHLALNKIEELEARKNCSCELFITNNSATSYTKLRSFIMPDCNQLPCLAIINYLALPSSTTLPCHHLFEGAMKTHTTSSFSFFFQFVHMGIRQWSPCGHGWAFC